MYIWWDQSLWENVQLILISIVSMSPIYMQVPKSICILSFGEDLV